MIIAIDYDDTLSNDLSMWAHVIGNMIAHGHEVLVVTNRTERQGNDVKRAVRFLKRTKVTSDGGKVYLDLPIVFAGEESKLNATIARRYHVQVWIDDSPWRINDSGWKYLGGGGLPPDDCDHEWHTALVGGGEVILCNECDCIDPDSEKILAARDLEDQDAQDG